MARPLHYLAIAVLALLVTATATADTLQAHNVDPNSVSVSGFSSGGFMAAQLGVAYSGLFQVGFGVFAGGPYDCARNQIYTKCMYNDTPSISQPLANMLAWSGDSIDCLRNLKLRRISLQAGTEDDIVGLRVTKLLESELSYFTESSNVTFVTSVGAAHAFPTDRDEQGNSACNESASPYIANCGYDGAGEMLKWLYGEGIHPRSTGTLSGSIVSFSQTGKFGAPGMATTGYLYVPEACEKHSSSTCNLHVTLHGCTMEYEQIGDKFLVNAGYNLWADTNNIIVLYPQTTVDNGTYDTWSGNTSNPYACWDWKGQYGDSDRKGGLHMKAIVNMVKRIIGGHDAGSSGSANYEGSELR